VGTSGNQEIHRWGDVGIRLNMGVVREWLGRDLGSGKWTKVESNVVKRGIGAEGFRCKLRPLRKKWVPGLLLIGELKKGRTRRVAY